MRLSFVPPNSKILIQKSKKVLKSEFNSNEIKKVVNIVLKAANLEQKDGKKPIMVGLAAPQIGILKRIILVDIKADGKGRVGNPKIYINPKIIWSSKKKEEWYEGCYSTSRVCGIVSRPTSIKIRTFILKFPMFQAIQPPGLVLVSIKEKYRGYVARIFQHEIDHLNGIRFPDLIRDPDKLHWVLKKEFPLYRNKQAWKNWNRKCSFEKWNRLKNPLLKRA